MGLVILLLASKGFCQDPEQPLQFIIKSDKAVYEIGEKITIKTKLTNVGDKELYINTLSFKYPGKLLNAIVRGPEVMRFIKGTYTNLIERRDNFKLLKPGESHVANIYSEQSPYNFLGYDLRKGIYIIQIIYSNEQSGEAFGIPNVWTGTLTSNTISIKIKRMNRSKAKKMFQ